MEEYGVEPLLGRVGDEDLERGLIARGVRQDRDLQYLEIYKMARVYIVLITMVLGDGCFREKIRKKGKI